MEDNEKRHSTSDWEVHKLLILGEVETLKEGQKEIKEDVNRITEKVTILQVKAMMATALISMVVSIVVIVIANFMTPRITEPTIKSPAQVEYEVLLKKLKRDNNLIINK